MPCPTYCQLLEYANSGTNYMSKSKNTETLCKKETLSNSTNICNDYNIP